MNFPARTEILVRREPFRGNTVDIMLVQRGQTASAVAEPLTFREVAVGELPPPTASLQPEEAQQLMDELWRAGLRPTEGTGSAGSLAATERHLKDMQAIAMGLLKGEF